jgi:hypothetical protein
MGRKIDKGEEMFRKYLNCNCYSIIVMSLIIVLYASLTFGDEVKENTFDQNSDTDVSIKSDTLRLIDEKVRDLENEITAPSSNERRVGSYLTISQQIVRRLIFDLEAMGPNFADYIYDQRSQVGNAGRKAIAISLGLMQDPKVHDEVRKIVLEESEPGLRGIAVRALSSYMDTLDVPAFIQALSDTNVVEMELDVFTIDGKSSRKADVVAMEAVPALVKFGYKVEIDTVNNRYEVMKIKDAQK